jgi:hypothetical protein
MGVTGMRAALKPWIPFTFDFDFEFAFVLVLVAVIPGWDIAGIASSSKSSSSVGVGCWCDVHGSDNHGCSHRDREFS